MDTVTHVNNSEALQDLVANEDQLDQAMQELIDGHWAAKNLERWLEENREEILETGMSTKLLMTMPCRRY